MNEESIFYDFVSDFKSYHFKKINLLKFIDLELFNTINLFLDKDFFYDQLDFILTLSLYE